MDRDIGFGAAPLEVGVSAGDTSAFEEIRFVGFDGDPEDDYATIVRLLTPSEPSAPDPDSPAVLREVIDRARAAAPVIAASIPAN